MRQVFGRYTRDRQSARPVHRRNGAGASDTGTLWVGLRRGRVFISSNADKASGTVIFYRIDTSSTPTRFVSGIAVDPSDPNHAFISFSGYNAYATASGTATGHVFDVHYDPNGHTADEYRP